RDRRLHQAGIGAGGRCNRIRVVRGQQLQVLVQDARGQGAGVVLGQGAQLGGQAFAGVVGGHAGPVAVQQAGAQQADVVGARREGLARGGQQRVERLFQVATVVAL